MHPNPAFRQRDEGAALDEAAATLEQLDRLAAVFEPRVIPENPWHRDKTDPRGAVKLSSGWTGNGPLSPEGEREKR